MVKGEYMIQHIKQNCGRELSYDDKFWKPIEVPEEFRMEHDWNYTLQYIGPIVDGSVQAEFPWLSNDYEEPYEATFYKTYAGVKGLRHCPTLRRNLMYRVFEGCEDFDAFEEVLDWLSKSHGGTSRGGIYDGLVSDKILEYSGRLSQEPIANILISWLNLPIEKMQSRGYSTWIEDGLEDALNAIDNKRVWDEVKYTRLGYKIQVQTFSKASELPQVEKCIICNKIVCNTSPYIGIAYDRSFMIAVPTDDFVNDINDDDLYKLTGYTIERENLDRGIRVYSDSMLFKVPKCTITAQGFNEDVPINTQTDTLTIKSDCGTEIILNGVLQQPCIGALTHTNMSYGRWGVSRDTRLKKLILDNVHIICNNKVTNFSLGTYGELEQPEIVLLNGATIDCPETRGNRVMVRSGAEGVYGSTKYEAPAEYKIEEDKKEEKKGAMLFNAAKF